MNILMYVGLGVLSLYLCWLMYVCAMGFKIAHDDSTLSKAALYLGLPAVAAFYLVDVIFLNTLVGTLLFLELPKWKRHPITDSEITLTARMSRWMFEGRADQYQTHLATWLCVNLLNPFQIGGHCRK